MSVFICICSSIKYQVQYNILCKKGSAIFRFTREEYLFLRLTELYVGIHILFVYMKATRLFSIHCSCDLRSRKIISQKII